MSVFQLPLVAGDTHLGDLISLGRNVVLFTARPELATLDGRTFVSAQHAMEAALLALQSIEQDQSGRRAQAAA